MPKLYGLTLATGNPILTLRNKILEGRMTVSNRRDLQDNLAFVFKAWNAWRDDKKVLVLRMGENEAYPIPH